MALGRLQNDTLAVFDSFNDNLREGNVGEFELALVLLLFEANIEDINCCLLYTSDAADE